MRRMKGVALVILLGATLTGCATRSLQGRGVQVTSTKSDVAGCREIGPLTFLDANKARTNAAQMGADVILTRPFSSTGTAYDCGGRYVPVVKTIPAAEEKK